MAIANVANPGERHINPLAEQRRERHAGPNAAARQNAATNAVAEDTYTPSDSSAQATAQAAGIFQLNPVVLAANTTPAQPAQATGQNAAPLPPAPVTPTNTVTAQAAAATAGSAATATQQAATTATGAPALQITAATTTNTGAQGQVQSLNNALAALGLSRTDIQQIDRIATLIQNFDPASYMDLVNQFQRAAQQAQQLATPANAAAAVPAAPAQTAAGPNAGGYQLQGISISYAGPTATANAGAGNDGGPGTGANNSPAAPGRQIQQVQFTLSNASGQTFQVQAPQQNTYAGTPNLQTPQTQTTAV
jgi:hypothetical protein